MRKIYNSQQSNLTGVEEPPMDVLLAISGNHSGVFEEVEVLVKSVLMNAPLNRPLTLHIMADGAAFDILPVFFWSDTPPNDWQVKSNLSQLSSLQQVTIKTYNVEEHIVRWERRIKQLYRRGDLNANFARRELEYHTVGTWFRLMADEILPGEVSHVLYLDVDIVVLANLGELWDFYLNREKWFQWGTSAGFVIFNVNKLPDMWQTVKDFGMGAARKRLMDYSSESVAASIADQLFLRAVEMAQSEMVGTLPTHWDNTMTDRLWRWKTVLLKKRPQIGYIHFNGGGYTKNAWFRGDDEPANYTAYRMTIDNQYLEGEAMKSSFGVADYYIRLDWSWVHYFVASRIPRQNPRYRVVIHHGHALRLKAKTKTSKV